MNTDNNQEEVIRPWGRYKVIYEIPGLKVKELTVNPGCTLSMQRHRDRSEYWVVGEGAAKIEGAWYTKDLAYHQEIHIPKMSWHRLFNPFDVPVKIVEIQYGDRCEEDDIERK